MKFEPFDSRYEAARDAALQVSNQGNGATVYRSSDPRLLELLGGIPAASGMQVTAESAMRVAAVYACVNRIAGGISTLPCNVYERTWDAQRQRFVRREIEDAPLWWLLNEQPTVAWTGASHWERLTEHRTLRGDHFTEIRRKPDSSIAELVPLPWGSVVVEPLTFEVGSRLMYAVNDGLRVRGVDQDDMLHFPGFGFDGVRGRSVISQAARNAAGNALAMDEYAGKFFAGGAHPSMVLQMEKKMSDQGIKDLQAQFARKYAGVQNAHALPLVLTEGIKAEPLSISAEDAQLLEARKFQVIDVARAFGVPPHMIGETSSSTSWGSGIESMGRSFVMYTLAQHLAVIEQELNRKLYRTTRRFIAFDRSALMQGDKAAQATFYRAALGGPGTGKGWMSVNDVRNDQNLPPLDGEDTIFNPNDAPKATPKSPSEAPA
jgi:HK97 family phage portal protein